MKKGESWLKSQLSFLLNPLLFNLLDLLWVVKAVWFCNFFGFKEKGNNLSITETSSLSLGIVGQRAVFLPVSYVCLPV